MTHAHDHSKSSIQRIQLALVITLLFVFFEAAAGFLANSLALLTDSAHNLTDVIALALSWYAIRLATRPAHAGKTYGYHRAGILIALLNATTLGLIAFGIFFEAFRRLAAHISVEAHTLTVVAAVAFVVNVGTALLVKRGNEHDLNMRSAFIHLAGDALSTFGAVLAGIGILITGFTALDPIVSILIGLLILWNAWGIVRESVDILLESTPRDVDIDAMIKDIQQIEGVRSVHDVHVWSITQSLRALSAHILMDDVQISAGAQTQRQINQLVTGKYNISHATLQLECVDCDPQMLYCDMKNGEMGNSHHH